MNELLGWYGYDKVDEQDTEKLSLDQFAGKDGPPAQRSRTISRARNVMFTGFCRDDYGRFCISLFAGFLGDLYK